MWPYWIALLLCFLICYKKQRYINSNKEFVVMFISTLPFLILAWLRDDRVGADTAGYPLLWYEDALGCNTIENYILAHPITEPLYAYMTYIIAKLHPNNFYAMLFYHALIVSISIAYISKYIKDVPCWFTILCLYLLLYHLSLNWARQLLALSFLIISIKYILEKRLLIFIIFVIIATGFHSISVVFLIVYPIYNIFPKYKLWKVELFLILFVFVISYSFQSLLSSLLDNAILTSKYERYLDQDGFTTHKVDLLQNTIYLIIVMLTKPIDESSLLLKKIIIELYTFCICLLLMGSIFETASRIELFFIVPTIIFHSMYIYNNNKNPNYVYLFMLIIMSIQWIYNGLYDTWDTIRYSSKVLGI